MQARRSLSPWRRLWRDNEGTIYITLGVFGTMLVGGLIFWAVRATSDFYATESVRSSGAPGAPILPPAAPRFDWVYESPIHFDFDVQKLVYGDKIIVSRDISRLIGDRLVGEGFELSSDSQRSIRLKYREREAETEIGIRPESDSVENPFDGTIRPIQIDLTLFANSPKYGDVTLLQKSLVSNTREVIIPSNSVPRKYGQYQRDLYNDAYAKFLDELRTLQLPRKAP